MEELEQKLPLEKTGLDLSLLKRGTKEELNHIFHDVATSLDEREKFGVRNDELCSLFAYTQEQIQRELAKYYKIKFFRGNS